MQFTLHGARLVDAGMDLPGSDITIEDEHILSVGQVAGVDSLAIDAEGSIIVPGFIEVHTHGGGGFNLHTTDVAEIHSYANWVASTGVTSFLVAVVGTPGELPRDQLSTAVKAIEQHEFAHGAQPLGIHLEGPYISIERRGAHPPAWLRVPDGAETEHLLELTRGYLRLITLAPELPGAEEMILRLREAGVTVSIGHTDATYEQAQEAIQLGITHATHCFNAMPPLLHRAPGPMGAIAQANQVLGEIIADGVHVHPALMDILVRILGPQRVIVVTDAQAAAGLPGDTTFEFAGQHAHVACGAARLEDGSLAGSVLTLDQALRNMLDYTHVSLQDAVRMLTLNPAQSAGVAARKGKLCAGYDADFLILDNELNLQATICRGQVAYATPVWRDRLPGAQ
jgi:N-acetylglucosamine-6-phosphate deacetylase